MAYVFAYQALTGTSMPVPPHQADDYLVAFYSQRFGAVTTPSGWTNIFNTASINGHIGVAYYKKAASSSETIPNGENTAGATQLCSVVVVRGATTTSAQFVDVSSSGTDAGLEYNGQNVTPTAANELILYFFQGGVTGRHCTPDHRVIQLTRLTNSQNLNSIEYTYGGAASVSVTGPVYTSNYNSTWSNWFGTIAIKDDGNNNRAGSPDPSNKAATLLHLIGGAGYSGHLNGTATTYDPTAEIPSITNDNSSYSDSTLYDAIDSGDSLVVGMSNGSIENASATSDILIAGSDFDTTAKDLSGKVLGISYQGPTRTPSSSVGKVFGLSDKTNSRLWQIDASDISPNGSDFALSSTIEVDGGFHIDDISTFNSSSVDALIIGAEINSGTLGQSTFGFLYDLQTMVIKNGTITTGMEIAALISNTSSLRTVQNQLGQTDTQYFCSQSIRFETESLGGGSPQSVSYPGGYDYDNLKVQHKVSSNTFSWTVKPPSGATHDISGWSFNMGDYHGWGISASSSGTVTTTGTAVTGCTPILNDSNAALSGLTISNSKEVTYTTLADLSGSCTLSGCVDTYCITVSGATEAALQLEINKLANCDFISNSTAIRVEYTGTGNISIDFDNITFTSNTTDIHYNSANSSQLTAVMENGSNATTSAISGSATGVTISAPSDDLVVTSTESGSLIQVFTTGTQTILSSTTGTSLTYTHSLETVDIVVQKAGFLPQRQTGLALSGDITVNITLVDDPVYDASHGLTYTTDASWSRTNNELTVPTFGPSVRAVHSLMIDSFISETSLRNTAYNIQMNGPNSMFLVEDAEGATDGDIENMTAGGVRYISSADATTAEWCGVESIGTIPSGATGEYQQQDGSGTTDARTTGKFDELIKIYGDGTHGNFDYRSHLVLKFQINGYYQSRVDVLDTYGISTLEPSFYVVAMEPAATGITTGDPAISITIVDNTTTPVVVGGKSFDYEIQDGGTNSAEDILREINYNNSLDATYQSKDPFNWPDMVLEAGGNYETQYAEVEGQDTTTTLHGFYVSRGGADHPDFSRFQSNDGTYYTPATVASVSAPNVTAGRIQIYNETAAALSAWAATTAYNEGDRVLRTTGAGTELGDGVFFVCTTSGTSGGSEPAWDVAASGNTTNDGTVVWTVYPIEFDNATTTSGYSNSWTDGEEFTSGDTIRLRWVDEDDQEILSTGVATTAGTTTFLNTPESDTVYTGYSIDGSTVTEYSADYPNIQVDVTDPDNIFYIDRFYAWWKYNLTLEDGIRNFFGGVSAVNASNITINNAVVDIYFDNTKAVSARQADNIVIQRNDGAYPQVTITSGGGGLGFYYTGVGYTVETGVSGLTAEESTNLSLIGTVDTNVDAVLADTNELQTDWADGGRLDLILDSRASQASVDALNDISSADVSAALSTYGASTYDPATDTVEGSETYQQNARLVRAATAGKSAVTGDTVTYRDAADTKDRITATTDSNGQRTDITTDAT